MDKYIKTAYDAALSAGTPSQKEACAKFKEVMLEAGGPKEFQEWSDEKVMDFAIDLILKSKIRNHLID